MHDCYGRVAVAVPQPAEAEGGQKQVGVRGLGTLYWYDRWACHAGGSALAGSLQGRQTCGSASASAGAGAGASAASAAGAHPSAAAPARLPSPPPLPPPAGMLAPGRSSRVLMAWMCSICTLKQTHGRALFGQFNQGWQHKAKTGQHWLHTEQYNSPCQQHVSCFTCAATSSVPSWFRE